LFNWTWIFFCLKLGGKSGGLCIIACFQDLETCLRKSGVGIAMWRKGRDGPDLQAQTHGLNLLLLDTLQQVVT
jgi:hypothetical protein